MYSVPLLFARVELSAKRTFTSWMPLSFAVTAKDSGIHEVNVLFAESSTLANNKGTEYMKATSYQGKDLNILKCGTDAQPVLQKKGDDLRIDWGYAYLATPATKQYEAKVT